MDFGIAGKVALVSGGSKGIGRAISEELGREGCRVVVAARGKEAVDETVEAITRAGGTAVGVPADFTKQGEIARAVAAAREAFGPPEIAVLNTYGPVVDGFDNATDEDFLRAYNDMVMSQVWLVREVVPAPRPAPRDREHHARCGRGVEQDVVG